MNLRDLISRLRGNPNHSPASKPAGKPAGGSPKIHPYHAVSIAPGLMSCPKARELRDVRFLSRAAPAIPLPSCTMPVECDCHFRKHNDRRYGDRRLFGNKRPDDRYYSGAERRRSYGRRATDLRSPSR